MRLFKTLEGLVLLTSTIFLATSCSKDMDQQSAKGENEVGKFASANCSPFLGIQTKQNAAPGTFAYLGSFNAPLEIQNFYTSDFSANNLLQFSATGGTPYYDPQFIRIGVNDQWIDGAEVLSLKIQNGKATKKMQMQIRHLNTGVSGTASFFLAGIPVGSAAINAAPGPVNGFFTYEATGDMKEFDEVQFSVISGKLAITGFTPNLTGGGQSGFFLVETPGNRVVLRLKTGVTNIGGTNYPNQYFAWTSNFVEGPAADRQNRIDLPSLASGSGEFTNSGSPVIPGSKTFVNIYGTTSSIPTPLGYRDDPHFRLGVGDQFLDNNTEEITITPGADFPGTKFRAVEVRVAALNGAQLRVTAYDGANIVGTKFSSGADKEFILVTSQKEFNRVVIRQQFGNGANQPSVGRLTPGPVGGAILLYPACN